MVMIILGSLSNDDGDGNENVTQKVNLRCFKPYRTYSISFSSSSVGNFFLQLNSKRLSKFGKRKRKSLSCVPVLDKTWNEALSRCSRATTAKKCTKKHDARAKLLFCQSKPLAFLPFSLPSLRRCLSSCEGAARKVSPNWSLETMTSFFPLF